MTTTTRDDDNYHNEGDEDDEGDDDDNEGDDDEGRWRRRNPTSFKKVSKNDLNGIDEEDLEDDDVAQLKLLSRGKPKPSKGITGLSKGGSRSSLDGKDLKYGKGAKHEQGNESVTPETSRKSTTKDPTVTNLYQKCVWYFVLQWQCVRALYAKNV